MRTIPAVLLLASLPLAAQSRTLDDSQRIEAWLRDTKVPALGIGIIRDGKLREVRVYGELVAGRPAPYDTIWNVASLSKPVVTLLTLQLVAAGKWQLDEPLAKYWVDPDVAADPRHALLTTRHVLAHQTGFPNWRWNDEGGKLQFHFDPGTRHQYSGEGFEYLRKALEKKFGRSLRQLSKTYVLDPVGMRDTQHGWTEGTDESRFAQWHDAEGRHAYPDHKTTRVNAADDLLTTIEDYGRFGAWVLNGADLPPTLFAEMTKRQAPIRDNLAMGLGWEVHTGFTNGETVLIHSGADEGVKSLIVLLLQSKQGLVLFANGDNGFALYERAIVETFGETGKEIMARAK